MMILAWLGLNEKMTIIAPLHENEAGKMKKSDKL
jgi:hypothetical protein